MIKVEIPRDKITYIRNIEGRKFKDGFWYFPESSLPKLVELKLVDGDIEIEKKEFKQYELSPFLFNYQKEIINTALNYGSYGLFMDTGTGKTNCGLEIATHHNKTLVVCPLSIIENTWINDCNKFYPNKKIISLWDSTKKKRLQRLEIEADIYVTNFEGLKIMYNEIVDKGFDCLIVDESSKIRSMKTSITQTVINLSNIIKNKYLLSGCPTPNHNKEIFPQIKVINPEIFGNNYHGFLAKYFNQDMENPHHWYQTDENKEKFFARLDNQSRFISKDDCVDLPEKIFQIRKFNMLKEQRQHYDNMINDINDNINTWSKFEFTAKLMKLRQISSGFVIGKESEITEFNTSKDEELKNVLDEIGNKQVIVWCQFNHEVETLAKKFSGVGLTSKSKNRNEVIEQFARGEIKVLFAHPKLIGHGLTFTNCTYNVYYSMSFSYEEFKQSQDRIHRVGQKNKCTYIILQANDTIDESIYKCLVKKKNVVDELYERMGLLQ